jgi:hypothetical protein
VWRRRLRSETCAAGKANPSQWGTVVDFGKFSFKFGYSRAQKIRCVIFECVAVVCAEAKSSIYFPSEEPPYFPQFRFTLHSSYKRLKFGMETRILFLRLVWIEAEILRKIPTLSCQFALNHLNGTLLSILVTDLHIGLVSIRILASTILYLKTISFCYFSFSLLHFMIDTELVRKPWIVLTLWFFLSLIRIFFGNLRVPFHVLVARTTPFLTWTHPYYRLDPRPRSVWLLQVHPARAVCLLHGLQVLSGQ